MRVRWTAIPVTVTGRLDGVTGPYERVEFVDDQDAGGGRDDLLDLGPADRANGPRRRWWAGLAVALLAVAVIAVQHRQDGPTTTNAVPTPQGRPPAQLGVLDLPQAIGQPRQLVAAGGEQDVVWALDRGSGIVRLDQGVVTGVQLLEAPVTAIAVDPAGDLLFAAVAGPRPALQEIDAHTMALRSSTPTPLTLQALAVNNGHVWGVGTGRLLGFATPNAVVANLDVALPGVITAAWLQASDPTLFGSARLTGLVTTGDVPGARVLTYDLGPGSLQLSAAYLGEVSVAVAIGRTWLSTTPAVGEINTTVALDPATGAQTGERAIVARGGRVWGVASGRAAFLSTAPGSPRVECHDPGGFVQGQVDLNTYRAGAVVTGPVLRTDLAFYAVTTGGLLRTGVASCT